MRDIALSAILSISLICVCVGVAAQGGIPTVRPPMAPPPPSPGNQLALPTETPELVAFGQTLPPPGSEITSEELSRLIDAYCRIYMAPFREALEKQRQQGFDPALLREVLTETRTCDAVKRKEYRERYVMVRPVLKPTAPPVAPVGTTVPLAEFPFQQALGDYKALVETIGWRTTKEDRTNGSHLVVHPSRRYAVVFWCSVTVFGMEGKAIKSLSLPGGGCWTSAAAFNDSGTVLAWEREGRLFVGNWDINGVENAKECTGHTRSITEVKFSQNRQDTLYSTSDDGTTRVWILEGNSCRELLRQRFGGYGTTLAATGHAYRLQGSSLVKANLLDGGVTTSDSLQLPASMGTNPDRSRTNLVPTRLMWVDSASRLFGGGLSLGPDDADVFEIHPVPASLDPFTHDEKIVSKVGSAFEKPELFAASQDARLLAYVRGYSGRQVYVFDTKLRRLVLSFEVSPDKPQHLAFVSGSYSFLLSTERSIYMWKLEPIP